MLKIIQVCFWHQGPHEALKVRPGRVSVDPGLHDVIQWMELRRDVYFDDCQYVLWQLRLWATGAVYAPGWTGEMASKREGTDDSPAVKKPRSAGIPETDDSFAIMPRGIRDLTDDPDSEGPFVSVVSDRDSQHRPPVDSKRYKGQKRRVETTSTSTFTSIRGGQPYRKAQSRRLSHIPREFPPTAGCRLKFWWKIGVEIYDILLIFDLGSGSEYQKVHKNGTTEYDPAGRQPSQKWRQWQASLDTSTKLAIGHRSAPAHYLHQTRGLPL